MIDSKSTASGGSHSPAAFEAYLVPIANSQAPSSTLSLGDLILVLMRAWPTILAFTLAGAVAGVTTALLIRPVYRAQVVLSPRSDADAASLGRSLVTQLGGLAQLAGSLVPGGSSEAETIATLKSRSLTEEFIRKQNLLPLLFEDQWDSDNNEWRETDPVRVPTLSDGFRIFDKRIRAVDVDRRTGLITMSIDWTDPELAAAWANELVARANETLRKRALLEATMTLNYLQRELDRTGKVELRTSLFQLVEAQQKTLMLANTRPEFALRVIDPAQPPGVRDRIWPKRPLISIVGTLLGGFLGVVVVVGRRLFRRELPA